MYYMCVQTLITSMYTVKYPLVGTSHPSDTHTGPVPTYNVVVEETKGG